MILFVLIFSKFAFSHIVLDEVLTTEKARFSLKTVCSKMVTHETPLIDIISSNTIDLNTSLIFIQWDLKQRNGSTQEDASRKQKDSLKSLS